MEELSQVQTPTMSPTIGKLAEALSQAQGIMEGAVKDGDNPFFKSHYATLHSTFAACRDPLSKNGLCVIQTTEKGNGEITVITTLAHKSGEWIKGELSITPAKTDAQTLGSCLSYLRRYSLQSIVGLSASDDDAEAAMTRKEQPIKQPAKQEPKKETPIQTMINKFATAKGVLNEKTGSDEIYYAALETLGVKHANEIEKVADGNKLLAEFRTFLKGGDNDKDTKTSEASENESAGFPPAED